MGNGAAKGDRRVQAQGAASGGAAPAATILYIEDDLSSFELVRRILSQRPQVRLFAATRGELGLGLACSHRPDLILLDLRLPDIPGDEVLRRLREVPETRDIPVVVISAEARAGHADRIISAGGRGYLTKPLDVKKLLALVDELLRESGGRGAGG